MALRVYADLVGRRYIIFLPLQAGRDGWDRTSDGGVKVLCLTTWLRLYMERITGIEPASSAWKADILPLNYIRMCRISPASKHKHTGGTCLPFLAGAANENRTRIVRLGSERATITPLRQIGGTGEI